MFNSIFFRRPVFVFRQFDGKGYSAFSSMKKEIRIGVLAIGTLAMAHNDALATRTDSLGAAVDKEPVAEISLDEALVTGTQLPMSAKNAWSKIVVITRQDIERAKCQTINDVLKLCPEVDVRQRGAYGVQTDISLGGGTFDQVSFLLNGININNPQTGHLSADFPVAISDIERIEVLNGASARTFGSQALNGIINIITRTEPSTSVGLHAEAGSYGTMGIGANANLAAKGMRNRISADYFQTDGAVANSNFGRNRIFYQGRYADDYTRINWFAGYSGQRYGANTFYSAKFPNQWEEGQRYVAAVSGESVLGKIKLQPSASFMRNYDHFQLIRHSSTGENYHRTDVSTLRVSGTGSWLLGKTALGAEIRHEGILSTNLGRPLDESQYVKIKHKSGLYYNHRDNRTNVSAFAEHVVSLRNFVANVGVMLNRNSAVDDRYHVYPGVDLSYRVYDELKLFCSWNMSMRMPTFTDLYYKSPTQEGNIGLKPEKLSTCKLGLDYSGRLAAINIYGIYRRGSHMIDWIMYNQDDIYHSAAFKLDNWQLVANASLNLGKLFPTQPVFKSLSLSYMYNVQKRHDNTEVFQSNYALDYLRNKITASLEHNIYRNLSAVWFLRWQERKGSYLAYTDGTAYKCAYRPYTILDLKVSLTESVYNVYASLENLLARKYYDLGSVPQPRFTFLIGAAYKFNIKTNRDKTLTD